MRLLLIIAFGLILGSSLLSCLGTPEKEDRLALWIGQMLMANVLDAKSRSVFAAVL